MSAFGKLYWSCKTDPQSIISLSGERKVPLEEAKYFGIHSLVPNLEEMISNGEKQKDEDLPLTRREIVKILASTECHRELRFQGLNLSGQLKSKFTLNLL